MKLRRAILLALLLALPAASAHAATPVTIGVGVEPTVALDPGGTAYLAWIGNESNVTTLHFCRLPRGATTCELVQTLPVDGTSLTRPFVTVQGSRVQIFTYRYGLTSGTRFSAVLMLTSNDGGATFDSGVQVGTIGFTDAVAGPGDVVSMVADNSALFQMVPSDGSGTTTEAHLGDDHPYSPSVAVTGSTILTVFANGSGNAQFRLHQSGGDPNDINTWTPAQDFSTAASYARLASGPLGTFLQSDDVSGHIVVQKFNGAGFDPPVTIPGPAHEFTGNTKDMTEDAGGRLHMVWPLGDAVGNHIGYATSDDGSKWQTATLEAGPNPNDLAQAPGDMRMAVAADHLGVAVWQDSASPKNVHAMAIGPVATPPPAIGKTANAAVVKGTVKVKLKGKSGFVKLQAGQQVPLGSTFDTTRGTVALDTSAGLGKPLQHGEFNGGLFTVKQPSKNPLTTLSMTGGGLGKCGRRVPAGGAAKRRSRTLFSSVKGRFRTRGRNSSATVRGTKWTMTDSCGGTLTIVKQGSVVVRDFTLRKNRVVKAGQRYIAKPPPRLQRRGNR
jgi:hypothetical protein